MRERPPLLARNERRRLPEARRTQPAGHNEALLDAKSSAMTRAGRRRQFPPCPNSYGRPSSWPPRCLTLSTIYCNSAADRAFSDSSICRFSSKSRCRGETAARTRKPCSGSIFATNVALDMPRSAEDALTERRLPPSFKGLAKTIRAMADGNSQSESFGLTAPAHSPNVPPKERPSRSQGRSLGSRR